MMSENKSVDVYNDKILSDIADKIKEECTKLVYDFDQEDTITLIYNYCDSIVALLTKYVKEEDLQDQYCFVFEKGKEQYVAIFERKESDSNFTYSVRKIDLPPKISLDIILKDE